MSRMRTAKLGFQQRVRNSAARFELVLKSATVMSWLSPSHIRYESLLCGYGLRYKDCSIRGGFLILYSASSNCLFGIYYFATSLPYITHPISHVLKLSSPFLRFNTNHVCLLYEYDYVDLFSN
ncbi:hypothetical protein L211DRAFT_708476 [Terfezia boudieri ATCC MYA-4762]|uniref:Uncharacterized protein n=1 Tax=Terfezia boudieri ATCC MYA-4762 TaxID=1051890 RepID=A0A3N4M8X1_9PEZI|nr:hypothetical protein L211DRAFT_708476 [Terfezia boudieri ATCC MYA-4762]